MDDDRLSEGDTTKVLSESLDDGVPLILTQLLKLSEDTKRDPEQVLSVVLLLMLELSMDSEKTNEIEVDTLTEFALSAGELEETVGGVVSGAMVLNPVAVMKVFSNPLPARSLAEVPTKI